MANDQLMEKFIAGQQAIVKMGNPKKLAEYEKAGRLNARERIDLLFDSGTFQEIGMFTHSDQPGMAERTPADGKIVGFGQIDGRPAAALANDMSVLASSSARGNSKKIAYLKRMACRSGLPVVFLSEGGGARIQDNMGAINMAASSQDPLQYQRLREAPWVSCLMGMCYGSPTWYACMSDFVVMTRKAVMAVSSPRVASLATGEETTPEKLGGWKVLTELTGLVDAVVDTDEACIAMAKKFLSYLPLNAEQAPPTLPVPPDSGRRMASIFTLLPENRRRTYDMRRLIECLVDGEEIFELKKAFGKSAVTCLSRLNGGTVGFIANNPIHLGGALDADACEKVTSFIVFCDSFNIPLILLVDTPGFLIGEDSERRKVTGKIINYMNALQLVTVPKLTIVIRKTYGQAFMNMGGGRSSDTFVAWPSAEISFMAPEPAVNVAYGITEDSDRERYEACLAQVQKGSEPWEAAGRFDLNDIIDPSQTREWLIRMLIYHSNHQTGGIGKHMMHCWPTSY